MGAEWLAWLGLIGVLLTAVHWALTAAAERGTRLPSPLMRVLAWVNRWPGGLDDQSRAERRRAERVRLARMQREAIVRGGRSAHDDPDGGDDNAESPTVEWDGNVARPQFGRERRRQRPHNLH